MRSACYRQFVTTSGLELADWERAYAARVVDAVNAIRNELGLSVRALRDRLESLGWSIGIDTLNGILVSKKRRSFSVGEVFTFSRALEVPPIYLMLGLPISADLPVGAALERGELDRVLRWVEGLSSSIVTGTPISPMTLYSRYLDDLRYENARWKVTGEERETYGSPPGAPGRVSRLVEKIAAHRASWELWIEEGRYLTPELPELPAALSPYIQGARIVSLPEAPIEALLDDEILSTVSADLERMRMAQWEVDRMKASLDGKAADSPE